MGLCSSCGQSRGAKFERNAKNALSLGSLLDKSSKICGQIHSAVVAPHEPAPPAMAASFSNMNLTNPIRGLVSKRRNRYKQDGFNLDLTYITPNIIAMGYPASSIESVYRNHIDDVVKLLERKHDGHYFIYNLCSERCYDKSKFHNRVKSFPFDDHNPPKLELIEPFCRTVHEWLSASAENVAAVHCKAGKGRTGTMICCYLLHSRMHATADEALSYYGKTRTQDRKGVTIPSQVRYVRYYEKMLRDQLQYAPVSMYIKNIKLLPAPILPGGQGYVYFSISEQTLHRSDDANGELEHVQKCTKLYKSRMYEVKRGVEHLTIDLDLCLVLTGDIKIEFYNKSKIGRKERQLQFWFNTFFVEQECEQVKAGENNGFNNGGGQTERRTIDCSNGGSGLCDLTYLVRLRKDELDIVNKKDKQNKVFSADFQLVLALAKIPSSDSSNWPNYHHRHEMVLDAPQDTPSESSEADSSEAESAEESWESVLDSGGGGGGGNEPIVDPRGVGYRILSECELASQLTSSSNSTSEQQPELLTA